MEILTFAAGLVVGTIVVTADLGDVPAAELRLDGSPVCVLSRSAPSCPVDLGPELAGHRLDLVRVDGTGAANERASRVLNRPGADEPELRILTRTEADGTAVSFGWAHPDGVAPSSFLVLLGGVPILRKPDRSLEICVPRDGVRQIVSAEATFPDGRTATVSRTIGGGAVAEAGDVLTAAVLELSAGAAEPTPGAVSEALRGAVVRSVEAGATELVVVLDPVAADDLADLRFQAPYPGVADGRLRRALASFDVVHVIGPETAGSRFRRLTPGPRGDERMTTLLHGLPDESGEHLQLADAVAAAGLLAAGSHARRVVAVFPAASRPDRSRFRPDEVRAFLADLMVPVVVLQTKGRNDAWPPTSRLRTQNELAAALQKARESLDRQRIVWLEGVPSVSEIEVRADAPFRFAGR